LGEGHPAFFAISWLLMQTWWPGPKAGNFYNKATGKMNPESKNSFMQLPKNFYRLS